MPGDAGASGTPLQGEDSPQADDQKYLARAVRGHFRDGALSRAQRHGDPEILSQRLERGAAQAVSRPAGPALEELEIFDGGHHRARAVEEISLIHISEPTRRTPISYAVFCLKKKKK